MAHAQCLDEQIKGYLLFRGFGSTLKSFDAELKVDKEKSFRVDKIIEQLLQFITTYDLHSVRELWCHLDSHMFTKLETHFAPGVKKLENAVLKFYLVNAVANNKPDKVFEFFKTMTNELQHQIEWKDWFVLPYVKSPEENPTFSLHFTKQWQDTLLVSLHNFLASIFQYMPTPTLMHFEDHVNKINKLEKKNESLKERLALLIDRGSEPTSVTPCQVEPPPHLLDDFYIIAQENNVVDSQAKSLRNLIRLGTGSSPILGRKETSGAKKRLNSSSRSGKSGHFQDTS